MLSLKMHGILCIFQILAICALICTAYAACMDPPAAQGFVVEGFMGRWYEVGKIQTRLAAIWQEGCVCTTMDLWQNSFKRCGYL